MDMCGWALVCMVVDSNLGMQQQLRNVSKRSKTTISQIKTVKPRKHWLQP